VSRIKAQYPELVGLIVLGSTSKGYWTPTSDLDWGLIFEQDKDNPDHKQNIEEIKNIFRKLASDKGFSICIDASFVASHAQDYLKQKDFNALSTIFNGLFFGDRQKLKKIQADIISNLDSKQWNEVRKIWLSHLNSYIKAGGRFGFSKEQIQELQLKRGFLWCPPDFNTIQAALKD